LDKKTAATPSTPFSFGAAAAGATPSLGTAGTSATALAGTATAAGGAAQQQAPISAKSRFAELPQAAQQSFSQHQNVLTTQTKLSDDLNHRDTAPILDVRERIALLCEKLATVKSTLACDRQAVVECKSDADALLRAAEDAARLAERLKSNNYTTDYSVQTPSPFFWQLIDQCESRMQLYTQHIDELARFLAGSADYRQFSPQMLRDIMQHQYELFMALASSVAAVHEVVNARKDAFLRARRRAMPREAARVPDPFEKTRQPTIDFFQPTAAQARELALETRAQLSEAAAAQAALPPTAATATGFAVPGTTPAAAAPSRLPRRAAGTDTQRPRLRRWAPPPSRSLARRRQRRHNDAAFWRRCAENIFDHYQMKKKRLCLNHHIVRREAALAAMPLRLSTTRATGRAA
jgi:hypothetical protein